MTTQTSWWDTRGRFEQCRPLLWHIALTAWISVAPLGCGARTLERVEGETHWLSSCSEGERCADGSSCICGACTTTCEGSEECSEHGSAASCAPVIQTRYVSDCPAKLRNASICVRQRDLTLTSDESEQPPGSGNGQSASDAGSSLSPQQPSLAATTPDASTSDPSSADARCGDGVVGPGEACEADADWCIDCKVTPMVVAGGHHTCVLLPTGGVKCWGSNELGQLGNGAEGGRALPSDVQGLTEGVRLITAGAAHNCALLMNGSVQCWGYNEYGQLGDGTQDNRRVPVDVLGLEGEVTAVMAGSASAHTCALLASGGVQCWGRGGPGGIGNGERTDQSFPVDVIGLNASATAVALGQDHTCVLLSTGGVECWGTNEYGQLGDDTTERRLSPVAVHGLDQGVVAIASANAHSCALLDGGEVRCWGSNYDREASNSAVTAQLVPARVDNLSDVEALTVGATHSCALLSTGAVRCWGDDRYGQLGNVTREAAWPVDVDGLTEQVTGIGAGQNHTCGWLASGKSVCWGSNTHGQLGNDSAQPQFGPVDVIGVP